MAERSESLAFDRVADRYDETRGGPARGAQHAVALEPLFSSRGVTLEIGVGTGLVAAALVDDGREVVGVDLSESMLRRARGRVGARVARADAQRLPVRDASVDDIYAVWLLHLVADPDAVLAEVRRVLRPAGRLVVVSANGWGGDTDVDRIGEQMRGALQRHRGDDPDRLAAAGAAVGLSEVGRTWLESGLDEVTPEQFATAVEERLFSVFWEVDEPTWQRVVVPGLEALRALPEPARARRRVVRHPVLVLQRG